MRRNVSVIVPTYNPNIDRLNLVLSGLKSQKLSLAFWELIIVDNNSSNGFDSSINLSWHPNSRIVKEKKQGLTSARLKGFAESTGDIIVLVDDDNILNPDYLNNTVAIFEKYKKLGCIGGGSFPIFESKVPYWINHFFPVLALRDFGNNIYIEEWANKYPAFAPIGAGMSIKREALESYITKCKTSKNVFSDRNGKHLSSGGDNDIVLEILKSGWSVGYFPTLKLNHIIPKERMQVKYLARLLKDSNRSWVKLLDSHGLNPWKKISKISLIPRFIKSWFRNKAWLGNEYYIRWKGNCGIFKGLSEI